MALQAIIFLSSGVVTFILVLLNVFLFRYSFKTNKRMDEFLLNGKVKEFKDIEKKFDTAIQKIGVVRFNPFNESGNQSFVIALLDGKNNGFVISSLFIKEGSRVYAKSVKEGKSEQTLSKEEEEAIERAIKLK